MAKNIFDREIEPIRATSANLQQANVVKQAEAEATTFRSSHKLTPEIEAKMMEVAKTIRPNDNTSPGEYLNVLFQAATAGSAPAAAAKEVVKRVAAAQKVSEPTRSTAPAPAKTSKVSAGMSLDKAFDAAFEEAQEEFAGR